MQKPCPVLFGDTVRLAAAAAKTIQLECLTIGLTELNSRIVGLLQVRLLLERAMVFQTTFAAPQLISHVAGVSS
jgi:hypothetical protein